MIGPVDLVVTEAVVIPDSDLSWTAVRGSGPGGQNVNKVATKVDLRFDLTGSEALPHAVKNRLRALEGIQLDAEGRVVIVSQATRDQSRNLEDARERLAEMIRRALVRPKRRRRTKPTRASQYRRLDDKRRTSEKKRGRARPKSDD
jgi:ribosome-associated protein